MKAATFMTASPTSLYRQHIDAIVEELEIGETRYEQAEESYKSLGRWFNRVNSRFVTFSPVVYVQGSFALGTVIKPLNLEEEYDIDSVCELKKLSKRQVTQQELKRLLGAEIEEYRRSKNMVKALREGRRCWTLNYADGAQFHMDVVPAISSGEEVRLLLEARSLDSTWAGTAINITDNERNNYSMMSEDWPRSNPKGYHEWFKSQMIVVLNERKHVLAKSINASVEKIPDYRVRTPLQASIMILKRHRDVMFKNDEINCCPISIIITTLAAHAYNGEEDVAEALSSTLRGMASHISRDSRNRPVILNPSDPSENFADKWIEFPQRERSFYKWLRQAQEDFERASTAQRSNVIAEALSRHVGSELAKRAEMRLGQGSSLLRGVTRATALGTTPSFGTVPRVPTKPKGFA